MTGRRRVWCARSPLIGAYLRDLGFADSMTAAARMLRGLVPINDALRPVF